jgi:hypothetical protein
MRDESTMRSIPVSVTLLSLALSGCVYANVREPLAYRSPTPADVGGSLGQEVKGEACNHVILFLFAFGDGGYDAAVADARATSHAPILADVKADTSLLNVLGVYQRQCTTVSARSAGLVAAASPAPTPSSAPATPAGGAVP